MKKKEQTNIYKIVYKLSIKLKKDKNLTHLSRELHKNKNKKLII